MRRGLLFAGTERGAFVSFDDGDNWQPLQLNLPVTSVRDFEIYENDLIVATHGRGFWVIDDISPLRQINDAVAEGRRAPLQAGRRDQRACRAATTARRCRRTSRRRRIRRTARVIDYYLKAAATGPVTLEILDASGAVVAHVLDRSQRANQPAAGGRGGAAAGGIPNTSPLWRQAPEPFSAARACIAWCGRRSHRRPGAVAAAAVVVAAAAERSHRHVHREAHREWPDIHAAVHRATGLATSSVTVGLSAARWCERRSFASAPVPLGERGDGSIPVPRALG